MTYAERMEKEKLDREHQNRLDELNGDTKKVKALKAKVQLATDRTNAAMFSNQQRIFNPRGARDLTELAKVRENLMSDPSVYFGTLDHAVVRKSYEFDSLNKRQQDTIQKQFPWMLEELEKAALPGTAKDEWVLPLEDEFKKLSEKEQSQFEPIERMVMVSYEELKGADKQPIFVEDGKGVSAASVMAAAEE